MSTRIVVPAAAALALALAFAPVFAPFPAFAQTTIGPETRLPLPRYVSLKTDKVNLRAGPSKDHVTRWVFERAGLPVEIIAEFDNWRRIRDSDGEDGWVWHSLLSGRRTALVAPWERGGDPLDLRARESEEAAVVARLEPGVVVGVELCSGDWCRVVADGPGRSEIPGYLRQEMLWGVYPGERVD
ncbi:SH3 domain-containing protein [Salinarimonas rosea]|uniref:SH3 domain-containing protein n=1 Tax=Salinarimonas rosea TaxID=552063 RepID=UPI0004032FAF|nr:SH3 domain-containing protein [Salinarimonas rosea]